MVTDEQARALRAIRDEDPIKAVQARVGVKLEMGWVTVPPQAGIPPFLSTEGTKLLNEWEKAQA